MNKLAKLIVGLTFCLITFDAGAAILGAPFLPEIDNRFNSLESGGVLGVGSIATNHVGLSTYPVSITGMYNSNANSGSSTYGSSAVAYNDIIAKETFVFAGNATANPMPGNVKIPANAIIQQVWFYTQQAVLAGTTIEGTCFTNGDLFVAAGASTVNAIFAGVETGSAATMLYVPASGCTPTMTNYGTAPTQGIVQMFIGYVITH